MVFGLMSCGMPTSVNLSWFHAELSSNNPMMCWTVVSSLSISAIISVHPALPKNIMFRKLFWYHSSWCHIDVLIYHAQLILLTLDFIHHLDSYCFQYWTHGYVLQYGWQPRLNFLQQRYHYDEGQGCLRFLAHFARHSLQVCFRHQTYRILWMEYAPKCRHPDV